MITTLQRFNPLTLPLKGYYLNNTHTHMFNFNSHNLSSSYEPTITYQNITLRILILKHGLDQVLYIFLLTLSLISYVPWPTTMFTYTQSHCHLPFTHNFIALKLSFSCSYPQSYFQSNLSSFSTSLISPCYCQKFVILHSLRLFMQFSINLFMLLIIRWLKSMHIATTLTHANSLIHFELQPPAIKHPL